LVEERDSGLNALATISQNPSYVQEMMIGSGGVLVDLVRTVGPLLLDPSHTVRHSAAGALR
jgi:hypothetical protein